MTSKTIITKTGKTRYVPVFASPDEIQEIMFEDNSIGFCIACGEEAYGVEPDARRYECESCEEKQVYGLEELVMMGVVAYSDEQAAETNLVRATD
jgi:hypothetical protein